MGITQGDHVWDCTEDESAEQSLYAEALGISDAFRDLELLPRFGEQYQVIEPLAWCFIMVKNSYKVSFNTHQR